MCAIRIEIKAEDPLLDHDSLHIATKPTNKLGYPLDNNHFLNIDSRGLEGEDSWTARVTNTRVLFRRNIGPPKTISRYQNEPVEFRVGKGDKLTAQVLIRYVPTEKM